MSFVTVLFYRRLQTLMRHKQIVLQPGLAPSQHVNCYALKPARRYTPDSKTHHHAQAAKQTVRVGGGLFAPCLRMSFLTTVKHPTGTTSPEQQAANPSPDVLLPSLELCHLTVSAGSWANTLCATARCSTTARKQKGAVNLYVHGLSSTAGTE